MWWGLGITVILFIAFTKCVEMVETWWEGQDWADSIGAMPKPKQTALEDSKRPTSGPEQAAPEDRSEARADSAETREGDVYDIKNDLDEISGIRDNVYEERDGIVLNGCTYALSFSVTSVV